MTPRRFDYRAFVTGWRALAAEHGLDAATGNPVACADAGWWRNPAYWADPGPARSVVEAAAITAIAAQARAAAGQAEPQTLEAAMTAEFRAIVREVLTEERATQHTIPLADLHALRGAHVEYIDMGGGFVRPVLIEAA